jgi:23S rRNA pseudouridine1911/1915/1917 synthase
MHTIKEHIVSNAPNQPVRLLNYCEGLFPGLPTKSSIKKAFKRGEIYLNHQPALSGHWVQLGDRIQWMDLENHPPQPYRLDLSVLYEDEHIAALDKPAGIPVSGNQFRTLQNAAANCLKLSSQEDGLKWPKPAHRLDVPTSGIVLFAKTAKARIRLGEIFEKHQITKTYHAIVVGKPEEKGMVDEPIGGKIASSCYEVTKTVNAIRTEYLSLVRLTPKTGRTHQLRIHLNHIGHPIAGDPNYGEDVGIRHKGLFLAATRLEFRHPITGQAIVITSEIPHKFHSLLAREQRRWEKYHG